ncbi:MAG: hypothetical protein AB8G17_06920 [Gammaproteobacteria bacterium]
MNLRNISVLLASAAFMVLTGCAQQATSSSTASAPTASSAEMDESKRKLAMLEKELRQRDRDMASLRGELESARTTTTTAPVPSGMTSDLLPPNPRPGECYARVIIPAQYKTTTRTVVKREASERIEVVAARYAPSTERILVKPASTKLVEVPAEYRTVTERVLDQPARTEWKIGTGIGTGKGGAVGFGGAAAQVDRFGDNKVLSTRTNDTGEVMCLVEIPATYKTITKQVLVKPATTRVIEVPAEYRTVDTMKLVQPASERRIAIPEQTEQVTTTEKTSEEFLEWRPVLCEINMTPQNVSNLQAALNKTGCCKCGPNRNECRVDGIMGKCTLDAARCYANKKGLPSGDKYVTIQVVRSLGLKF